MDKADFKTFAAGDLESELKMTRALLERIPDDKLAWKPHEKSLALGELAAHLANLPVWQAQLLVTDGIDVAEAVDRPTVPKNRDEVLARFDKNAADVLEALARTEDQSFTNDWTLVKAGEVLMTRPKYAVLRQWGISHMVHHRAQLTVYLRLLDVPLPPIYGSTADETPTE